jgi:hypothetical protein
MEVHVFGAAFWDVFIESEAIHSKDIWDMPGGSGLNIALALHFLGHCVQFRAVLGADSAGYGIARFLETVGMDLSGLQWTDGATGLLVSKRQKALSVRIPPKEAQKLPKMDGSESDFAVALPTEISHTVFSEIIEAPWECLVADWGPRGKAESPKAKGPTLWIGNEDECRSHTCDIIKMGPFGARWGVITVAGSGEALPYPVGAGDLFDAIVVDGIIRDVEKERILKEAVRLSEIACQIPGSSSKAIEMFGGYRAMDHSFLPKQFIPSLLPSPVNKPVWHQENSQRQSGGSI